MIRWGHKPSHNQFPIAVAYLVQQQDGGEGLGGHSGAHGRMYVTRLCTLCTKRFVSTEGVLLLPSSRPGRTVDDTDDEDV